MNTEDRDLIQDILSGNTAGFEKLVDKYQGPVFNAALRITKDRADAEDAAQSAFIKAYENLESFNPRYRFFSWLYRIVVNESLNLVKKRRTSHALEMHKIPQRHTPEDEFREKEVRFRVQEAVFQLPVEYRVLVELKHFQGFSYREISYIVGISEKKVKSRLYSARFRLKELLAK